MKRKGKKKTAPEKQPRHRCIICGRKRNKKNMHYIAPVARNEKGNVSRAIWQCKIYCGVTSPHHYEVAQEDSNF